LKRFLIYTLCICYSFEFSAQKSTDSLLVAPEYKQNKKYIFKTNYGSVFVGYVVKETKNNITIEKNNPHEFINLKKSEIDNVKKYSKSKKIKQEDVDGIDGVVGFDGFDGVELEQPTNNYLFVSSAFLFQKDKITTSSHYFLIEKIDYAFNKNWAATSTCFGILPISLGFKCVYQLNKKNYLGFNAEYSFGTIFINTPGNSVMGYVSSFKYSNGNIDNNFTLSAGLAGLRSDGFIKNTNSSFSNLAYVNAAYFTKFITRFALTAETWYFPEVNTGLIGLGIKTINNQSLSWTFGCFVFTNSITNIIESTTPLPYIGILRVF
jgi:hypothetical protein